MTLSQVRPYFRQPADPAAQRQAGNPRLRDGAEGHSHAVDVGLAIELAEQDPRLGANALRPRIDVNALHAGEVDDHAAVAHRAAADVVSAASNRHEQAVLAREPHGRDDVGQPGAAGDHAGIFVDAGIPDPACDVVLRVAGANDGAAERAGEGLQAGGVNLDSGGVDQRMSRHGGSFSNLTKSMNE